MTYQAYIVELKNITPHPNADRLNIAHVFGSNVIVGKDLQVGDVVAYFPSDGQLSLEFAEFVGGLLRKRVDGVETGGYMDPEKRNIKAIKLRGSQSDGLIVKIQKVADYVGLNVDELQPGTSFNILNGKEVCRKYVPKHKKAVDNPAEANKKLSLKDKYPLFKEHVDTKQLAYNMDQFKKGDRVTVSLKLHGCFSQKTKIKTDKNRAIQISEVKKGDYVLGVHPGGKIAPTKVINTFINGTTKDWLEVKTTRKGERGEPVSKVLVTPNHQYLTVDKETYRPISEFSPGDSVLSVRKSKMLTSDQKSILVGKFLGDGHLAVFDTSAELQFSHAKKYREYMDFCINSIGKDLMYFYDKVYISGYGTEMLRAKTGREVSIYNFFKDIVNFKVENCEDKLKDNIVDYFDEKALAFFYMDDGSLSTSKLQKDRANFAICDYNDHDALIISRCLDSLGLDNVIYKDIGGYNRIRLNHKAACKMFDMIHKYIPENQKYKLPVEYRDKKFECVFDNKIEDGYDYIENEIVSIEGVKAKRGYRMYDIETETHNYIAGGCIVHNSSGRTAKTAIKAEIPSFWERVKNVIKPTPYSQTYEVVSGSRRVILDGYEKPGYYGSNDFRYRWTQFFEDKLHKGEIVFYEIVGWYGGDENQTIMPIGDNKKLKDKEFVKQYGDETVFSYGTPVGESDIYVYRMATTNEDGQLVEYPTELAQIRCEQMGVKHAPVISQFTLEQDGLEIEEELMQYFTELSDGADLIDPRHIREGIIVRIENRETFTAYKHKGFSFKVLESIIKDFAEEPDMEEQESE